MLEKVDVSLLNDGWQSVGKRKSVGEGQCVY